MPAWSANSQSRRNSVLVRGMRVPATLNRTMGSRLTMGRNEGSVAAAVDEAVAAPVWTMPGHADGTVTVYLGNGRKFAGRVGGTVEEPVGFNAYPLRTSKRPWFAHGVQIAARDETAAAAEPAAAP